MVKWTAHARVQLRQIHDYIAKDSPLYAKKVAEDLVRKSLALDELPRLGRVVPELGEDSVRELAAHSYRILYEIDATDVSVLAIIHKRRDLLPEEIPTEQ